jgi:hypothetical protein
MAVYVPTVWADEIPDSSPVKYSITGDVEGELSASAVIAVVTGVTAGTAVNAANLNHLEGGVEDAQAAADTAIADAAAALAAAMLAANKVVQFQIADSDVEVTTSLVAYFFVPMVMDGYVLTRAQAFTLVAGTTNPTTIQIRDMTLHPSNDALSGAISIASGATVGTPGTVNASYNDVEADDKMRITVTGQSTTPALGLYVILEYEIP